MKNVMTKMMVVGVLALTVSGVCSANLLVNGGFENPVVPPGGLGTPAIPDWTISAIYWHLYDASGYNPPLWTPLEGAQSLYLYGGTAKQVFGTVQADTVYTFTFGASTNDAANPPYSSASLEAYDGGVVVSTLASTSLAFVTEAGKWYYGQISFDSATMPSIVGKQIGVNLNSSGLLHFDDASVVIPEPITSLLLGIGGLYIIYRKRM